MNKEHPSSWSCDDWNWNSCTDDVSLLAVRVYRQCMCIRSLYPSCADSTDIPVHAQIFHTSPSHHVSKKPKLSLQNYSQHNTFSPHAFYPKFLDFYSTLESQWSHFTRASVWVYVFPQITHTWLKLESPNLVHTVNFMQVLWCNWRWVQKVKVAG